MTQDHEARIAELEAALRAALGSPWVANAAHTNDIEALRRIVLFYGDWNNRVLMPAIRDPHAYPPDVEAWHARLSGMKTSNPN
jgi:hypothetical protein